MKVENGGFVFGNIKEDGIMAVKIRLARGGTKKRPYYRIVVADSTSPRDGKFIEKIGTYNPLAGKESADRLIIEAERAKYWLGQGAVPSERVESFLVSKGLLELNKQRKAFIEKRNKASQEKLKQKQAAAAAEAAAKAAAEQAAA